ncbi:hypothetical protein BH23VER1_BH23VER1_24100 [soil metagenome]
MISPCTALCLFLIPTAALASPDAIRELSERLPESLGGAVAALAESHVAAPLAHRFEGAWWHLVFYRWYEIDRAAAGAFAMAHVEQRPELLDTLLRAAHERDPGGIDAFAESLGARAVMLLANIRASDHGGGPAGDSALGERVAAILSGSESGGDAFWRLRHLLKESGVAGPGRTLDQIERLDLGEPERKALMSAFIAVLKEADPATVAGIFDRLPEGQDRADLAKDLAHQWATTDPAAATAWARSLTKGPVRDTALAAVAQGQDDPLAILDLLESRGWEMDLAASVLSSRTVAPGGNMGTSGAATDIAPGTALRDALAHLVAEGRPGDAIEILGRIPDPRIRHWMLRSTVKKWIQSDPEAAGEFLLGLPETATFSSREPAELISTTLGELASRDELPTAIQLLDRLETTELRKLVIDLFVRSVAPDRRADVTSAILTWTDGLAAEPKADATGVLLANLVRIDPAAATEIVRRRPGLGPAAYSRLTSSWYNKAPEAASQWVADLPPGAQRDAAIQSIISHVSGGPGADFPTALTWAGEISDPELAGRAIKMVTRNWRRADPDNAP